MLGACRRQRAADGTWTHDLFLTKEVLYHWATTARILSQHHQLSCRPPEKPMTFGPTRSQVASESTLNQRCSMSAAIEHCVRRNLRQGCKWAAKEQNLSSWLKRPSKARNHSRGNLRSWKDDDEAGRGNRTLIHGLEGRCTSRCTTPAVLFTAQIKAQKPWLRDAFQQSKTSL